MLSTRYWLPLLAQAGTSTRQHIQTPGKSRAVKSITMCSSTRALCSSGRLLFGWATVIGPLHNVLTNRTER
jgi:hypothetical protein